MLLSDKKQYLSIQAQEVAPANTTKKHRKSTKKTAGVVRKETTSAKQTEVKTAPSAEASKKETASDKHKKSKAK